jgi:hypothetical protein
MPLTYKNHTIVAGAARSQISNNYIPVVYITWEIADRRGNHSIIRVNDFRLSKKRASLRASRRKLGLIGALKKSLDSKPAREKTRSANRRRIDFINVSAAPTPLRLTVNETSFHWAFSVNGT